MVEKNIALAQGYRKVWLVAIVAVALIAAALYVGELP